MIDRRTVVLSLAAGLSASACALPPAPERAAYLTASGAPPGAGGPRAGLLLPLSGENAELGHALLDAARQALGEVEPGPLVLVPQDTATGGAGAAARRAVELGCGLLIGPLGAGDAPAAVAAVAPRPVLVLSNDIAVASPASWPFGLDPESQAARVAAFALTMGRTRLGAVVPDDAYGAHLVRGLQAVLALRPGVALVATATHPPVAAAGGPPPLPADLRRRLAAAEVVLVGAGGPVPNAVAAALRITPGDPNGPRLLGTQDWLKAPDPSGLPPPAGAWIALPDPAAAAGFAGRYRGLFHRLPSALDQLVADAVGVAAAVGQGGGFPLPVLTRPEGFAGRLGSFRLLAGGRVERLLAVGETAAGGGSLAIVDPAPVSFAAGGA